MTSLTFEVELLWDPELEVDQPSPDALDIEEAIRDYCRKKGLRVPDEVRAAGQ